MNLDDIRVNNEISVLLSPKNEADYPEQVKVRLLKKIPVDENLVFIGELLTQTKQDFAYNISELLMITIVVEDNSIMAVCNESFMEATQKD